MRIRDKLLVLLSNCQIVGYFITNLQTWSPYSLSSVLQSSVTHTQPFLSVLILFTSEAIRFEFNVDSGLQIWATFHGNLISLSEFLPEDGKLKEIFLRLNHGLSCSKANTQHYKTLPFYCRRRNIFCLTCGLNLILTSNKPTPQDYFAKIIIKCRKEPENKISREAEKFMEWMEHHFLGLKKIWVV